ncbi:MAG TPA: proprotein convertase P-domain-containing protein [Coleofasciculaceae cyanobacterium]|jgi:subtilisin-like proprotein convertase family protein/subtilisin family serine protease
MSNLQEEYSYRAGQKINLVKRPDQFIVRSLPNRLKEIGIPDAEQVSSASSRVTTRTVDLERLMSEARHLAPTHHAYQVAQTGEDFLITDRIFVTFREPLTAEQVDTFTGRYGLVQRQAYSDRDYLFQLTDHTGINPVKLVVKLTEDEPQVESAEHDLNYLAKPYESTEPTDPFYKQQWHLHTHLENPDFDPRASSRCEAAWQLLGNFGSSDVVVGVTDDGCKLNHPDFDSPGKFAGWAYFVGDRLVTNIDIDANPAKMYKEGANHGTSCAGVIAAELDGVLTVGAAPGCRLLPVKWESKGSSLLISDSKLLTTLNYVADKVDILSNSWGIVPTTLWPIVVTKRIAELAKNGGSRRSGIVFLWAAGNDNCPIQHTASVNVPYTSGWDVRSDGSQVWYGVETSRNFQNNLLEIPGVMHVAALASTAQRSHYSNYGTGIGICAPTNNRHEYRRLTVRGLGVTTTIGSGDLTTPSFGGTSSATPLVAGIAALTLSANPELTALEVISILKRTASKDLNLEGYSRTPAANYDPNPSWDVSPIEPFQQGDFLDKGDPDGTWSPWFGHGRVDALNAVTAAQRMRREPTPKFLYKSNPERAIPDNDPTGIQDIIRVLETGRVRDIFVNVNITHSWIGDLRVQLTAPNGMIVLLHDRTGASQDKIQQTYNIQAIPALASLRNSRINGDWTLQVQDVAANNVGILQSWALEIDVTPEPVVMEDTQVVEIPDNDPNGIVRTLSLPAGIIQDLAVSVDITHPWLGDLRVALTLPDSTTLCLHDRTGGAASKLVRTWHLQELPTQKPLRGSNAGGTWQLQVADLAAKDVGKLNRWHIEVTTTANSI